jgi:hypothetical protein
LHGRSEFGSLPAFARAEDTHVIFILAARYSTPLLFSSTPLVSDMRLTYVPRMPTFDLDHPRIGCLVAQHPNMHVTVCSHEIMAVTTTATALLWLRSAVLVSPGQESHPRVRAPRWQPDTPHRDPKSLSCATASLHQGFGQRSSSKRATGHSKTMETTAVAVCVWGVRTCRPPTLSLFALRSRRPSSCPCGRHVACHKSRRRQRPATATTRANHRTMPPKAPASHLRRLSEVQIYLHPKPVSNEPSASRHTCVTGERGVPWAWRFMHALTRVRMSGHSERYVRLSAVTPSSGEGEVAFHEDRCVTVVSKESDYGRHPHSEPGRWEPVPAQQEEQGVPWAAGLCCRIPWKMDAPSLRRCVLRTNSKVCICIHLGSHGGHASCLLAKLPISSARRSKDGLAATDRHRDGRRQLTVPWAAESKSDAQWTTHGLQSFSDRPRPLKASSECSGGVRLPLPTQLPFSRSRFSPPAARSTGAPFSWAPSCFVASVPPLHLGRGRAALQHFELGPLIISVCFSEIGRKDCQPAAGPPSSLRLLGSNPNGGALRAGARCYPLCRLASGSARPARDNPSPATRLRLGGTRSSKFPAAGVCARWCRTSMGQGSFVVINLYIHTLTLIWQRKGGAWHV